MGEGTNPLISDTVRANEKSTKRYAYCHKLLLAVAILFAVVLIPVVNFIGIFGMYIAFPIAALTMIILFCKGVISLRRIKTGNQLDSDQDYAWPSVIVAVVIVFCLTVFVPGFTRATFKIIMGGEASGTYEIKSRLKEYSESHGDTLPDAENWCDELRKLDEDEEYDNFKFGRREKQIAFGFNQLAAKLRTNVPDDMVLFFECESGWNVTGGPELAKGRWDDDLVWILFGDLSSKRFRLKDIKYLRWEIEDDGVIPQRDNRDAYLGFFGVVGVALIAMAIRCRGVLHQYWRHALGIGISASLMAAGCSLWAELLYRYNNDTAYSGWIFALAVDLGIGFVYVLLFGTYIEDKNKSRNNMPFAVASGAITGIICSCVIHGFLMIAYEETSLLNMGAGAIFGGLAGVILGRITSAVIKSKNQIIEKAL